ncbi:MAG: PIN domain-containing protein [Promethearchaeota archaeon]
MKPIDKHYLLLQFQIKIYSKKGIEFQHFFEDIMEKVYPDFQKIKPYGRDGDGGNDGYRKKAGIYYQVYAPNEPVIKESSATKKMEKDYNNIKEHWNEISEVKEYYFVYNNEYSGSVLKLEEAITQLNRSNTNINFDLFLPKNLENIFFDLSDTDMLELGFNIDSRQMLSLAYKYLEKIEIELDRENGEIAFKILRDVKDIIFSLNNNSLELEYEILECRCLQKLEKVDDARKKYNNIGKRFPNDSRSFLYLAELYLREEKFDKNMELLKKAEKIDANYWLLKLEKLVRKIYLGEKVDISNIDENEFSNKSNRIKANFYRLYTYFLAKSENYEKANSFIKEAIHLNSDRFSNYIMKISIMERKIFSRQNNFDLSEELTILLKEIEKVETKFLKFGNIVPRNKSLLKIKKLQILMSQENYQVAEKLTKEIFEFSLTCFFDKTIDDILIDLLKFVPLLPDNAFEKLLKYLEKSEKEISNELAKVLILQFNIKNNLLDKGEKFFKIINKTKYLDFIYYIENKNCDNILKFLKEDYEFAIAIASTIKGFPDLRKRIIENLPNDKNSQKDKLFLLLNYGEEKYDEAFKIIKKIGLSNFSYLECKLILKIIHEEQAWDYKVIILEKLLEQEKKTEIILNLKMQLFNANFYLKKYSEVIRIGEELLEKKINEKILDKKNKEILLTQIIISCFKRENINKEFEKAKFLLEKYSLLQPTFEFKVGIEAKVYLINNNPQKALESVVEGVKIKKILSPEEYAKMYFIFIQINNLMDINLKSLDKIKENTFVKLKNKNRWYFIGNKNELDAIKISKENDKYSLFIDKKINNKIIFKNPYSSESYEEIIENIFPIEKYILCQTHYNFQKLSINNDLNGVQTIQMIENPGTFTLKYLLEFLKDSQQQKKPFFDIYCKNNIPLAMLAVNEGGLTNAIGHIQKEKKGFIHFSTGTFEELESQKKIAKKVIDNKLPFYLDGTTAFVLSEMGLFEKVFIHLPNLKISQSVINSLINVIEKFNYIPGQMGTMGYAHDKIIFSNIDQDRRKLIQSNFKESIKLLESKPNNISVISLANKVNCFSEQKVPAELSDACILAQKENIPILTEDFPYLKMNELETKKKAPEYFSSIILLKILNEQSKISFEEYLDFFGYLSSYRFRFLSLNSADIEKAIFGDGKIKTLKIENIRKLNFPLTLSEEYGVQFQKAFLVVARFFYKILMDDTIIPDVIYKIFIEIIESFPTKIEKSALWKMFTKVCEETINKNEPTIILNPTSKITKEKINKLNEIPIFFNPGLQL